MLVIPDIERNGRMPYVLSLGLLKKPTGHRHADDALCMDDSDVGFGGELCICNSPLRRHDVEYLKVDQPLDNCHFVELLLSVGDDTKVRSLLLFGNC